MPDNEFPLQGLLAASQLPCLYAIASAHNPNDVLPVLRSMVAAWDVIGSSTWQAP